VDPIFIVDVSSVELVKDVMPLLIVDELSKINAFDAWAVPGTILVKYPACVDVSAFEPNVNVAVVIPVPTYNDFAIAAPPAVVKVPPFVDEVASVVFEIAIPPASISPPVLEDVDAVLELMVVAPVTLNVPPTLAA
jgi:hypothetical protein